MIALPDVVIYLAIFASVSSSKPENASWPCVGLDCNEVNVYESFQVCQCDNECHQRNNCCNDAQYCIEKYDRREEEFSCIDTKLHGHIYMIDECLPGYPHEKIVSKCRTIDEEDLLGDFLLSLSVTSERNITYRNLFCAICNNEPKYTLWNVAFSWYEMITKDAPQFAMPTADIDLFAILKNVSIDEEYMELISEVNGKIFQCDIHSYLPSSLSKLVRYCHPNKTRNCLNCEPDLTIDRNCSNVNISCGNSIPVPLDLAIRYLPKSNLKIYEKIWEWQPSSYFTQDNECGGPACQVINETDFYYVDTDTVGWKGYTSTFRRPYWGKTLASDVIYFCDRMTLAREELRSSSDIKDVIFTVLDALSVFFLIGFVVIMILKKKFSKNLSNGILFSIGLTLVPLYFADRIPLLRFPCSKLLSVGAHYLGLSLYMWLLIVTYDFWQNIGFKSSESQAEAKNSNLKKYLIYGLIGWISPLCIISVSLYFDSALSSQISCEWKPEYGRTASCGIENETPFAYFYAYPATIIYCIIVALFLYMSYAVFLNGDKEINKGKNFFKLALIVLPWTLDVFYIYTNNHFLITLYFLATSLQGVFIFFAFGFEESKRSEEYEKVEIVK